MERNNSSDVLKCAVCNCNGEATPRLLGFIPASTTLSDVGAGLDYSYDWSAHIINQAST